MDATMADSDGMPSTIAPEDHGPDTYLDVVVPFVLRSTWAGPEAYWWRRGVRSVLSPKPEPGTGA